MDGSPTLSVRVKRRGRVVGVARWAPPVGEGEGGVVEVVVMTANVGGSGLHSQWLAVQQAAVDADVVVITEAAPVGAAERFADPDHGEGWVEVGMDECRLSGVSQQSLGHTSSGGVHVMVRRELRG